VSIKSTGILGLNLKIRLLVYDERLKSLWHPVQDIINMRKQINKFMNITERLNFIITAEKKSSLMLKMDLVLMMNTEILVTKVRILP
jgi:hypothetical protein